MPNLVNLNIQNESIIPRIVGFYEYHNALKLFDRLASISTVEEMKVYDNVLNSKPEFGIYVGRPSTAKPKGDQVIFGQAFKQNGLGWMTALARVEIGAMVAAFSERENPFKDVAPTRYGAAEFNHLLAEGWESHLHGIQFLAKINEGAKGNGKPAERGEAIVKISRRAKLASDMVVVAAGTMSPSTSEGKYEELQSEYDQLQDYRDQLSGQLSQELNRIRLAGVRASGRGWQTGAIPSCARGGVEAALAQGRFTTKPLN